MSVKEIIEQRRAYRSLDPVKISKKLIRDLAHCASLAPSCYNNQPWHFAFVRGGRKLAEMRGALWRGNEWARDASMIIAVYSSLEDDCETKGRAYYLLDTGLATAFLILRATELGLVAHPIAGYDENKVKEILDLPAGTQVITLIIVGGHATTIRPSLSEQQAAGEAERPERFPFDSFARVIG
jgi:nitroreductase